MKPYNRTIFKCFQTLFYKYFPCVFPQVWCLLKTILIGWSVSIDMRIWLFSNKEHHYLSLSGRRRKSRSLGIAGGETFFWASDGSREEVTVSMMVISKSMPKDFFAIFYTFRKNFMKASMFQCYSKKKLIFLYSYLVTEESKLYGEKSHNFVAGKLNIWIIIRETRYGNYQSGKGPYFSADDKFPNNSPPLSNFVDEKIFAIFAPILCFALILKRGHVPPKNMLFFVCSNTSDDLFKMSKARNWQEKSL